MLILDVPGGERYIPSTNEFIETKPCRLTLEHSLRSLHKWEQKWHKPFLSDKPKTNEELLDYVRCMTITQNVNPNVYRCLTAEHLKKVNDYIDDPMTGTTFNIYEQKQMTAGKKSEIPTAEIIYYWMISYNIPVEFQNWHLETLLTLIKVCNIKNEQANPKGMKKIPKSEMLSRRAKMNAERRKALHTTG